jgi:hypothetical protein
MRRSHFLSQRSLALAAGSAALLTSCGPAGDSGANRLDDGPVLNLPAVPTPPPPMGRAELLAAAAQAASAAAAGTAAGDAQRSLDGRQFELRIRFGCGGPAASLPETTLGWAFNPEKRTLRLRAMPTISADGDVVAVLGGDRFEAIEGFWIPRPWLLDAVCPAPAPETRPAAGGESAATDAAPDAEPQTAVILPRVGIAQFYTSADPRTGRRSERAYEAVKTLAGKAPGGEGFNLVLSGRLRAVPGRGVIACAVTGPDQPPDCIISADFDRVRIENPVGREVLAEWRSG